MRWIIESVLPARRRARQWIRQGNAARDRRDWPAAQAAYGRALQDYPPMPPIWVQYGHAAKESGDLAAAEAAYRRALALQADFADGYLHLGHALKLQGQAPEALEAYAKAASLAPAEPDHALQLGHALNGMGRRPAAVEAFRRALALAPERAEAALELGHALLALKEPVGALEAYRQAFRAQPEQPAHVWMQQGHAARGAGDPAAAEAAFRRARELTPPAAARASPQGMSPDAVGWAMRLFLGREPSGPEELERHMGHADLDALRRSFAGREEFTAFTRTLAPQGFTVPLFLLAPPASPQVPWCFTPPGLSLLNSQFCTAGQLEDPAYAAWCQRLTLAATQHRRTWEFCYIGVALEAAGLLQAGSRGLGFGGGQDPLPAHLAACGVAVVAAEAPGDPSPDPAGFDFCWSAGAVEHRGSLRAGLDFVVASLGMLRPGGIAVHTMAFNLSSNTATLETPGLSLMRRQDIEALIGELTAAGHEVATFNTHPGDREVDAHIDAPPYGLPHLKLQLEGHTVTSLGMIIRKGEAGG